MKIHSKQLAESCPAPRLFAEATTMAPKMSKPAATASVLKSTIKKRPAGTGSAADVLSQAALLRLENASDAKITSFLDELSDKEGQRLWKSFEQCRKSEHSDEQYRAVTSGTGGKRVAKSLLKVYIKSGQTTRSDIFN